MPKICEIGYGKGYYDKTLAKLKNIITVGLAYSFQEIEAVPHDEHDIAVDYIITEKQIITCKLQGESL